MKFRSTHFPNLKVNGAGRFVDGELVIPDVDAAAIAKVRAVAPAYGIQEVAAQPTAATAAYPPAASNGELKGAALDAALKAAGLPLTGRADDKRARLAVHQDSESVPDTSGAEVTGPAEGALADTAAAAASAAG